MKFIIKLLLILIAAIFIQPYVPWWSIMLIALIVSVIIKTNWFSSFACGFLAIGGLWLFMAIKIDQQTDSILTNQISSLFSINSPTYLILMTAFIGALAAGFAGLTGHTFIKLFEKKKSPYY